MMLCYIPLIVMLTCSVCHSSEVFYDDHNFTHSSDDELFQDSRLWKQGDIPLLNRKIFKGMRVTIREHPYVASIRRNLMHYSVATVLTRNLFITVAHPLIDVPLDELTVVVGENFADRGATLLTVMLVVIHGSFNRYNLVADIALLRVYEDTPFRCSVKSIQLVPPRAILSGLRAFVTGWGRCDRMGNELCLPRSGKYTPGEKFDPMLRSVSFIVSLPNPYCNEYRANGVLVRLGMLCDGVARAQKKLAPCLAAPGAPLVVNGNLAGILSWGFGCGFDHDLPLVYTSMQYYQPWLIHNIPILRRVHRDNLTILFEAKRAYILTKWLNLTRIEPPRAFTISDKPMVMLKLDKELARLDGHVYDIRDYLYDGVHHKYKTKLYNKMREKFREREMLERVYNESEHETPTPFLNPALTAQSSTVSGSTLIIDEVQERSDTESYDEDP